MAHVSYILQQSPRSRVRWIAEALAINVAMAGWKTVLDSLS
jgi:hypothetical protein